MAWESLLRGLELRKSPKKSRLSDEDTEQSSLLSWSVQTGRLSKTSIS